MGAGIIILGMHRSGTSLVASLLHRWGIGTEGGDLVPPDRWNERGYWEHKSLIDLNHRLILAVNSRGHIPPPEEARERLVELALNGSYREHALEIIAELSSQNSLWFMKDPRLAILLPFWTQFWSDVSYVVTVRNPLESAQSLFRRDGVPVKAGLVIWQRYMMEILSAQNQTFPRLVINYHRLLQAPLQQCERLAAYLNEQCHPGGPPVTRQKAVDMASEVCLPLRHHDLDSNLLPSIVNDSQQRLFEMLDRLSLSNVQNLDLESCYLPPGWREDMLEVWLAERSTEC